MAPRLSRRGALMAASAAVLPGCAPAVNGAAAPSAGVPSPPVEPPKPPSLRSVTIAFGSCNKPALAQPLWEAILSVRPTAFAWLGDIVYTPDGDTDLLPRLYAEQAAKPDYARLVAATRVVGVWDDHDYGWNDGGREFAGREAARAALLDFLREPAESPRRSGATIHASYDFGEPPNQVKLCLLDVRSERELPGEDADTLGAEQWSWLERELSTSRAVVNLVASSIQILPQDHPYEKWTRFPRARARLLELLASSRASGVVLLSGDRHLAEISSLAHPALPYRLYELTSSGMTHSFTTVGDEPNALRVGSLYSELNFGLVQVDPEREIVRLEARGVGSVVALQHELRFSELRR